MKKDLIKYFSFDRYSFPFPKQQQYHPPLTTTKTSPPPTTTTTLPTATTTTTKDQTKQRLWLIIGVLQIKKYVYNWKLKEKANKQISDQKYQ